MHPEHWLYTIPLRLRSLFGRHRLDEELDEELRDHVERKTQEYILKGMTSRDARRQALIELGGVEQAKEKCRDTRRVNWLQDLAQDVRYGLRMLRKSPGFTAVAILTLALGIGANTAIFSLVDAVMLKTLPVKNPHQLVLFEWDVHRWPPHSSQTGRDAQFSFSYPVFEQFQSRNPALSSVFAFVPLGFDSENTTVTVGGEPTLANGMMVTGQYFSGLGVTPLLGRTITEADEAKGAPRVAVLSHAYWTRRFGRDPSILGKNIALDGVLATIVGVAPPSFYGEEPGNEPDFWVAFDDLPNLRPWGQAPSTGSVFTDRNWLCLNIMGRLKPDVSRQQAQSALDAIFHQFITADWTPDKPEQVPHLQLAVANQGLNYVREAYSQPLYILMLGVGLVLLIACANLATLLLARASFRTKEMSIRLAIGASRARLVHQLLTESVLLAAFGGTLGFLFSRWGTQALLGLMSSGANQIALDIKADARVWLFTLGVSALTGVLFGLAPAFRATRVDLVSAMKESASNVFDGHGGHRLGESLVILQVAASLVLLIGAGLFVRTLSNLEHKNLGFDENNLLVFGLDPTRAGYEGNRLENLYGQLLVRIQTLPGVKSVTLSGAIPLSGWSSNTNITVEGSSHRVADADNHLRWITVGPDFFQTMGIPVVLGRGINESDVASSERVAVVDETFVRTYLRDAVPLGHRFYLGSKPNSTNGFNIIGVVKPAELTDLHADPVPKAYMAYAQLPEFLNVLYFLVRTAGSPTALLPEVRDAVRQMDPNLPLMNVSTQADLTADALTQERLFADLSSLFGLLALVLSSIGLYGTMAYSVSRKTHQIGIRLALGANPHDVLRMVLIHGVGLTLAGIAIGVVGALAGTRLISGMIYGVKPTDPLTFGAVALFLTLVALLACYVPARRAMRVDPMVALRYE